jgi:hypothetical protein
MQVGLISVAEYAALSAERLYDAGSLARYTAKTNQAKEIRQMEVFGCRHCEPRSPDKVIVPPSWNVDGHWRRRFTFDGLVSHAKEK